MPLVWIRSDAAGAWPVMTEERDELACADDVDWHFVAAVENRGEGERLLDQLRLECAHQAAAPASRAPLRTPGEPELLVD